MSQTDQSNTKHHPCLSCGACCAYFRVSFSAAEVESKNEYPWQVPLHLIEQSGSQLCSMKGTTHKHRPSCVCLVGKVGVAASCSIYESRPTPCRQFTASYEDGKHQPRCDEARRKHGLKPLSRDSFKSIKINDPEIPI